MEDILKLLNDCDNAEDANNCFEDNYNDIVRFLVDLDDYKGWIERIGSIFKQWHNKTTIIERLRNGYKLEKNRLARERIKQYGDVNLVRNTKNEVTPTQENIVLVLLACHGLNIRYDEYTGNIYYEIYGDNQLPWTNEVSSEYLELRYLENHDEKDVKTVRYYNAMSKYHLAALKQLLLKFFPDEKRWFGLQDALLYAARQNHINIYQDWINNALPEWDLVDRMDFLHRFAGVENREWATVVGHTIFLGMMARCFEPGYDFRGVPVLEGPQNSGKSRLCRALAFNDQFFLQFFFTRNMEGYEVSRQIAGSAVVEFPEMGGTRGKDQNYIKAFLSTTRDTNRRMHSDIVEKIARTAFFIITTNEGGRYFMDQTGNSRYEPVYCNTDKIDVESLLAELPQLFAQAKYLWDRGIEPRLTKAEEEMQQLMVASREMRPAYYDHVLEQLKLHQEQMIYDMNENWDDGFTMEEMLQWMQTEAWFANKTKTYHRDQIRKVLLKYFKIDSKVKKIPAIRRRLNESEITRKWRYIGELDFRSFLQTLEEEE